MSNSSNPNLAMIAPAVLAMLESSGTSIEDLAAHLAGMAAATPKDAAALERSTVAAFVNEARRAGKPGSVKSYTPYWRVLAFGIRLPSSWTPERIDTYAADLAAANRDQKLGLELPGDIHAQPRTDDGRLIVRAGHGHQQLGEVTQSDVQVMMKWVGAHARAKMIEQDRDRHVKGRPFTRHDGQRAQENFITAIRCLYAAAAENKLVAPGYSPAKAIKKPPRHNRITRRPLADTELRDVWITCSTTGNDPELDALIVRVQLETSCRQEGCINLVLGGLDDERQSVWLSQKGDKLQEFPVTATLLRDLRAFAISRGASAPEDHVLRQKARHRHTGEQFPPMTSRRFDNIHERVKEQHHWANRDSFSSHWLRHHTAATIEAIGGRPCKMRILDHQPNGQTDTYGPATFEQLAWAVAVMTGEPHPLAQRPPWITG